jgi:type IV secretory pathway VirB3-like protein
MVSSKASQGRESNKSGATSRMYLVNLIVCTLICIFTHSLWGVLLFVVVHLLAVRISAKESDYFNLNMKYFVMMPTVLNRWYCSKN